MEDNIALSENSKQVQTSNAKCMACGANMVFDPDSQSLYCSHCGTKQSFKTVFTADEIDLVSGFASNNTYEKDEVNTYVCDNCGAKTVVSVNQTTMECPFCGTSHVTISSELPGVKPNGVLPFSFGIDKGIAFAKTWAKKRLFSPRKFKKNLNTENVKGVYTPCFTFDSHTFSEYSAKIGITRTRVVGSGKNRRTQTYTEWRYVNGKFEWGFDDVLISAGDKIEQKKLDKIRPFETKSSSRYEENFLLGFSAYHYDRDVKDCWDDAKKIIDKQLESLILGQYHYDVLGYINVSTTHTEVTYKYVMLPVYVGNFVHNKKLYNFYVNGTNGKVSGKAPVSFLRVFFTTICSIGLIALIIWLISLG